MIPDNLYNLERSLDTEEAKEQIESYLKSKGFVYKTVLSDDVFEVSHVSLHRPDGHVVSEGSGKGKNHLLGAPAEAIEHFISNTYHAETQQHKPLKEIALQPAFQKDFYIHQIFRENPCDIIRAEKFNAFAKEECIWVPAGYIDPKTYDKIPDYENLSVAEKHIARIACNNGSSLGLSLEDSLLHGLNECIERHYLSLLFQDILNCKTAVSWKIYDNPSNTSYVQKRQLIEEKAGQIVTLCAQTIFGNYVSFSLLVNNKGPYLGTVGGGGSTSLSLAVQRSIDEVAQLQILRVAIKTEDAMSQDKKIFKVLNKHKGLHPLIFLPRERVLSIAQKTENSSMQETGENSFTTKEQIELLVKNLVKHKYAPSYKILSSEGGVWVTQVFIPGFDPFYLIRDGILIAPLKKYETQKAA